MATGDEETRAENEASFRDANEHIRAAERELDPPIDRVPYLCECDDVHCHEPIRLTAGEYERVRRDGATFLIVPGHSSTGEVLEEHESYLVVCKQGDGGQVARALDPRKDGAVSDERARRVGLNEAIFRQVNEQIRDLNQDFGTSDSTMTVICECGYSDCTDRLEVEPREYERVRSDPRLYVIAKGHEIPAVEHVVEQADGYAVVKKDEGVPAELSRELDPRS